MTTQPVSQLPQRRFLHVRPTETKSALGPLDLKVLEGLNDLTGDVSLQRQAQKQDQWDTHMTNHITRHLPT